MLRFPPPLPPAFARRAALVLVAAAAACTPGRNPVAHFTARPAPLLEERHDVPTLEDGHVVQAVRLRDARGLSVDLLLKRPVTVPDGARLPVVLLLGGHHTGRGAARLIPDTRGHAIAALSYPYQGKQRGLSILDLLRAAPSIRRAVLDTPPATRLALDWLLEQPWADSTRVEAVGASLGVPFMSVATALDPRITRLWLVHGAGDNRRQLSHALASRARWKPVRSVAVRAADALLAGDELSADRWVPRVAPRPVVMINATADERLPRVAVDALHAAARDPKTVIWMPGGHVQRTRPEIVRALVAMVLERMEPEP
jgi:dienelactone hydrolase